MSIQRAGIVASLVLMLFLLTGGYYVQVYIYAAKNYHARTRLLNDMLVSDTPFNWYVRVKYTYRTSTLYVSVKCLIQNIFVVFLTILIQF